MHKTGFYLSSVLAAIFALAAVFSILSAQKLQKKIKNYEDELETVRSELSKTKDENTRLKTRINEKKTDSANQVSRIDENQAQRRDNLPRERERTDFGADRDPAQIIENMRNRFEELKNNNPERYNEILQRMNDFSAKLDEELKNRIEYLKDIKIDESAMTPEEIENYNKLLDILENNSKTLSYLIENPEADNASALRAELFRSARETIELFNSVRKTAIKNIGLQNGLSGEKLKQFEESINKVYEMTSFGVGRFGFRGSRDNKDKN